MKPFVGATIWLLIAGTGVTHVRAASPVQPEVSAAIQAIQQAADPSAVVAAYASGFGVDRTNPVLHHAYIARMVDLGLPELAFHQAQLLTGMDASNGLAWGVIAYVDARRGEMSAAAAAINLAGQSAPDHVFVQRTAGEILAWFDAKGAGTTLADEVKHGMTRLRETLAGRPAFTEAYAAAKKAYTAQAPSPASQVPPGQPGDTEVVKALPVPVPYVAEYAYDWGPYWVGYWPWFWWRPVGFFHGCFFRPSFVSVVFIHDFHHVHKFHHHHPHHVAHHKFAWHNSSTRQAAFFGLPARPAPTVVAAAQAAFVASNSGPGGGRTARAIQSLGRGGGSGALRVNNSGSGSSGAAIQRAGQGVRVNGVRVTGIVSNGSGNSSVLTQGSTSGPRINVTSGGSGRSDGERAIGGSTGRTVLSGPNLASPRVNALSGNSGPSRSFTRGQSFQPAPSFRPNAPVTSFRAAPQFGGGRSLSSGPSVPRPSVNIRSGGRGSGSSGGSGGGGGGSRGGGSRGGRGR
ncbi:MAG: hypothetical protein HZC54_08355 [Verrucomicrobia bacterium]|nr:hypothetical protein [Verrucomicrobiota bacterium]